MNVQPKKKNILAFLKSKEFKQAQVKLCAMYIIVSYANELHEDIDKLLQGYEGLWIGDLKHASKLATKALDEYAKKYESMLANGSETLCDATIDVTRALDVQLEQSKFFLQESYKAVCAVLNQQIEERVTDKEYIENEQTDFELCSKEDLHQALQGVLRSVKPRLSEFNGDVLKGVEVGFNTAVNWIFDIYKNA